MSFQVKALVKENREVAPKVFRMVLYAPEISLAAKPGQFLHIRVGNSFDPLLRRPLSINGVDQKQKSVSLLFRVAGRGTLRLSQKKEGQTLDVLGPLGRGFTLKTPAAGTGLAVIAGGMGVAPLYFLLYKLQELKVGSKSVSVFLGAQSKGLALQEKGISEM
ncbi:MAG: dihydroorotate dehydrogenase electron transfer subunit, partial [Desulfotomaculaceae bacterium]